MATFPKASDSLCIGDVIIITSNIIMAVTVVTNHTH